MPLPLPLPLPPDRHRLHSESLSGGGDDDGRCDPAGLTKYTHFQSTLLGCGLTRKERPAPMCDSVTSGSCDCGDMWSWDLKRAAEGRAPAVFGHDPMAEHSVVLSVVLP